jgi:uncharacterized Fe-S radical SAM superfamily protein PflX
VIKFYKVKIKGFDTLNHLLKSLEPNVRKILQSILTSKSSVVSILHNDNKVFKIDKIKLIRFLVKTKINHITFYDIDYGTRYSILFKLESNKHKTIEVLISEDNFKRFKQLYYLKNNDNIKKVKHS